MKQPIPPIRTGEELFHALSENGIDADCLLDSRLRIIYATPSTEHVLGYSVESVLGQNMLQLIIHPDDRRQMLEHLLHVKHSPEETVAMRFRLHHRDGKWRWMRGTARNLLDHPAVQAIACNCYDISEIVEAEEERSRVLEVTRCILWEADVYDQGDPLPCWKTRIVNPAAARDFLPLEQADEESYGDAWYRSRHNEDSALMDAAAADALRSGKSSYTQEFRCQTRDGNTRWMLEDARIEPIEPCHWHVVGVVMDITERKRADERLSFLAKVSGFLTESLDYQTALQQICSSLVPDFAESCRIDLVDDDGSLKLVALGHSDSEKEELSRRLTSMYPPKPGSPHPALIVSQTGESYFVDAVSDELLREIAHDERHFKMLLDRQVQSIICVPLEARGEMRGTLMLLTSKGGRVFEDDDLKLAEEIGRRAAIALDNARLYGELEISVAERRKLAEERERVVQSANCILWESDVHSTAVKGLPLSKWGLCWDFKVAMGYTAQQYIPPWELDFTDSEGNWHACKHPDDRERMDEMSAAAILSDQSGYTQEFRCRTLSGQWKWLHEDVTITQEAEGHWHLVGVVTDITEKQRASERLSFLARVSGILTESLEYEAALQRIANAMVSDFADWARIDMLTSAGDTELVAIAAVDPDQHEWGSNVTCTYPPKPGSQHPVLVVLKTGRSYFAQRVEPEVLQSVAHNEDHFRILQEMQIVSTICVPLEARGQLFGAITLVTSAGSGRVFDESDLELAEEIGRRAAIAIDNARLYSQLEQEVKERSKLEEDRERVVRSASCILWEADVYSSPQDGLREASNKLVWDLRIARGSAAERFIPPESLDGTDFEWHWHDCKHPDDRGWMDVLADEAIRSGQHGYTQEFRCRTLDGEWKWLYEEVKISIESSDHWRLVGVVTDITERKRSAERMDLLVRLSGILHESLEFSTALQQIADALVPDFADWSRIDLIDEQGELEVVAVGHADPASLDEGKRISASYPPKRGSLHPVLAVMATGRSYFAPRVHDDLLRSIAHDHAHLEALRREKMQSAIFVPLQARGNLIGTLGIMTSTSERVFNEDDRALAEEIGRRAAVAIDNARLYGQLDRAVTDRMRVEDERDRVISSANCILWESEVWTTSKGHGWSFHLLNKEMAQRFIPADLDESQHARFWDGIKHPDDSREMSVRAANALETCATGYTQEFRARSLDGSWRWLREDVRINSAGVGRWHVVGVCTDVTDARALQEQRDRVMLAANCLLWEAEVVRNDGSSDEEARVAGEYLWSIRILNSDSARRFLQMDSLQTIDCTDSWFRSKHPDDRLGMDSRSSGAISTGLDGYSQDYRCRTHEGEWRWLHEDARIERVDEGKWRVVGACTDITDIKDAEAVLSHTNQQLTALISIISEVSSTLHLERILKSLAQGLSDGAEVSALLISEYAGAPSIQRASWNLPDGDIEEIYRRIRNGLNLLERQNAVPDFLEACAVLTQTLNVASSTWQSYLALPLLVHGHFNGVAVLIAREPGVFDHSPVNFYESLAHAVAIAVQNARLFEQIRDANERLQEISRQMVEVQEEERRQIARDLHDEIGQLLTGMKIQLQLLESAVPGAASAEIARVNETVTMLMGQVRDMSLRLRPPILDDFGLGPALTWLAERYCDQTGIRVELDLQQNLPRLSSPSETAGFRFVQEALTNIARYAGVEVAKLTVRSADGMLTITVLDRGIGFDIQAVLSAAKTAGIGGMRERISLVGGTVTMESTKGVGTSITARIPAA